MAGAGSTKRHPSIHTALRFDRVPVLLWIISIILLNLLGVLSIMFGSTSLRMAGASSLGITNSLYELISTALAANYQKRSVAAYCAGTGVGYIFGPLYYTAMTSWFHVPYKIVFAALALLPFIFLTSYYMLRKQSKQTGLYQPIPITNTDDVTNNVTIDITNDVTNYITDDVTNDIPDDFTNDITNDVTNNITNDVTDNRVDDVTDNLTNDVTNDITNDVTDNSDDDGYDDDVTTKTDNRADDVADYFTDDATNGINDVATDKSDDDYYDDDVASKTDNGADYFTDDVTNEKDDDVTDKSDDDDVNSKTDNRSDVTNDQADDVTDKRDDDDDVNNKTDKISNDVKNDIADDVTDKSDDDDVNSKTDNRSDDVPNDTADDVPNKRDDDYHDDDVTTKTVNRADDVTTDVTNGIADDVTDKSDDDFYNDDIIKYLSIKQKLYVTLRTVPKILQIVLGILSHDLVMGGVITTLAFSDAPVPPTDQYKHYIMSSLLGMCVGRGYLGFVDCVCPALADRLFVGRQSWVLVVIAVGHVITLVLVSWYRFLPSFWIVLLLVFTLGLFSEAIYANVSVLISEISDTRAQELSMGLAVLGVGLGAVLSAIIASPVEEALREHCLSLELVDKHLCFTRHTATSARSQKGIVINNNNNLIRSP